MFIPGETFVPSLFSLTCAWNTILRLSAPGLSQHVLEVVGHRSQMAGSGKNAVALFNLLCVEPLALFEAARARGDKTGGAPSLAHP